MSRPEVTSAIDSGGHFYFLPQRDQEHYQNLESMVHGCYWDTWSSVPREERNIWYGAFKIKYKWDARIEANVRSVFNKVASRSFQNFMSKTRKKPSTEKPDFMHIEAWQTLCRRWRLPEFIAKSNKGKNAREANKRLHTGGSAASNGDHNMKMAEELERDRTAGVDKYLFQYDTDDEPSIHNSHEDLDRVEDMLKHQELKQGFMRDEINNLRNAQEDQSRKLAQVLEAQVSYGAEPKKDCL
ncbi:hypothetical protein CTI12_AA465120 [Artemisia annua]|uniref:Uncharacterized protein n=1 Tax=Artemisia annua TaxID=35608 RepID=A0A2U1LQU5_ARTAN|nr:hypothetical protein CTI12_AA465120 [Artemisia annua]